MIRNGRRGVIVAHPGVQHSYETALGVQQAGMLQYYVTGLYSKRGGALGRLVQHLPRSLRSKVERELRRRCREGLDENLIKMLPMAELAYVSAARLGLSERWASRLVTWRNGRFADAVGSIAQRENPLALHCYDTAALGAFARAKPLGIFCILDQSIADMRLGLQLLREEAEIHPEFADTLATDHASEDVADLCREETMMADLILAPSEYVRGGLVRAGVDPSRVAVQPYGVDVDPVRPVRRRSGVRRGFKVLFVGQIGQRKGIRYLLEALKQLKLKGAELVLVGPVAGSGRGLARYSDYFTWIGSVPYHEVGEYFEDADIFVFPTLHEGSARVTYEALAAALPVITTANSGSIVRDGVEGFIVPIRDTLALQEKILLLYSDRELREEMGRRARERAQEFSWAAYRERLASILRSHLAGAALDRDLPTA